jgi:hypothetical protein
MGYIFTIKFDSNEKEIKKYIKELKKADKDDGFDWCEREDCYVRWDNYERDISRVSEKFPNVLITVYQEHEDNSLGDYYDGRTYKNSSLTVQYFKYGKFTKEKTAKITISFDEFNEKDEESLLF